MNVISYSMTLTLLSMRNAILHSITTQKKPPNWWPILRNKFILLSKIKLVYDQFYNLTRSIVDTILPNHNQAALFTG